MKINFLSLNNFRSFSELELDFNNDTIFIYGDNGEGKTNIIEAIYLFTGGSSFRGAKNDDMILFLKKSAKLELHFFSDERNQVLELEIENGKRKYTKNHVALKSSKEVFSSFCAVVVTPSSMSLVQHENSKRRTFLDESLCQTDVYYSDCLLRYNALLKQRNCLLKSDKVDVDLLRCFDIKLSQYGDIIRRYRAEFIKQIEENVKKNFSLISKEKENIYLNYKTIKSDSMLEEMNQALEKDLALKQTTKGVHRDNIDILFHKTSFLSEKDKSLRTFGSQGQQRSALLALKLAQADYITKKRQEACVLLLDDVLSELDETRQKFLINNLENYQVFLTSAEDKKIIEKKVKKLFVQNGKVTEISNN